MRRSGSRSTTSSAAIAAAHVAAGWAVAFCGHGSAGKTTLIDKLIVKTGAVSGHPSVDDGTSICDFDPEEKHHRYTISSGKQGIAVAQAALDAGARVILVAGPTCEEIPYGAETIHVQTTQEMGDAILSCVDEADVLFMVAAVADFRPNSIADRKIKKTENADWGANAPGCRWL